jgi:hypothetical protein
VIVSTRSVLIFDAHSIRLERNSATGLVPALAGLRAPDRSPAGPAARRSRDPRAACPRGPRAPAAHRKTGCRLLLLRHPGRLRRQRGEGPGLRLSL